MGSVARFLDSSSRDHHWLRLVIRSLASFEGPALHEPIGFVRGTTLARGEDGFGTQHIKTGIGFVWENGFVADRARFLDPFFREHHWLRLVIRSLASFDEWELASFGEAIEWFGGMRLLVQIVKELGIR